MLICVCLRILASSRIPRYDLGRQTPHFLGGSVTEEEQEQWLQAKIPVEQPTIDHRVLMICPQNIFYKQLHDQYADQLYSSK
jgi:hypothetical protein